MQKNDAQIVGCEDSQIAQSEVDIDKLPKDLERKLRAYNDGVIELTQEQGGSMSFYKTSAHEDISMWQQKIKGAVAQFLDVLKK